MATKVVDLRKQGHLEEDLPNTQTVLHVEYTDPDTGFLHTGAFKIKRLNLGDIRRYGIRKAELNGGMSEDCLELSIRNMNVMRAHLDVAILSAPEWWKPDSFYNGSIIMDIYEEVMSFEDTFRSPVRQHEGTAQGVQGDSQIEVEQPGPPATTVVDKEVSAPGELG